MFNFFADNLEVKGRVYQANEAHSQQAPQLFLQPLN